MLFFRRPQQTTDILTLVRVNDRVQLEIKGKTYTSRIEDIRDGEIYAAAPVDQGNYKPIGLGEHVVINVFAPIGLRRFAAVVRGMQTDRIPVVVLTSFRDLGCVQRRHYVRISQKLPVRYRKDTGLDTFTPWSEAVTADISGGGLRLVTSCSDQIKVGDSLEIELYLPEEKPIHALANVVWVSAGPSLASLYAGVQFAEIHPADRDKIVGFVFKKETEMGDTRRASARSRQRIKVVYRETKEQSASFEGYTFDISAEGVRIVTNDMGSCEVGDTIELELDIPGIGVVQATGQVIWHDSSDKSKAEYHLGVKFTKISRSASKNIAAFLMRTNDDSMAKRVA